MKHKLLFPLQIHATQPQPSPPFSAFLFNEPPRDEILKEKSYYR